MIPPGLQPEPPIHPNQNSANSKSAGLRLALVLAAISFALFLWQSLRAVTFNAPIWFEGPVLGFMQMIRTGRLYQACALHTAPYSVLTHTPLSYLLDYAAWTVVPDVRILRLINVLATLGCAFLVARLAHQASNRSRRSAVIAAALLLGCSPVFFWSQIARSPDSLACLFSLATILAIETMRPSLQRDVAVGVLLVLAVFSKQHTVFVLIPAVLLHGILIRKEPLAACRQLLVFAAIALPVFFVLQWATAGGFLTNAIGGNLIPMSVHQWLVINRAAPGFALFAAVTLIFSKFRRSLTFVWMLFALAFGVLGTAKVGADSMYYFDAGAALAILAAASLARMRANRQLLFILALLPGILLMDLFDFHRVLEMSDRSAQEYRVMMHWLASQVGPSAPVLSDSADYPIALGRPTVWDDPFVFTEWEKTGRWSDADLVSHIREHAYGAIITTLPSVLLPQNLREQIARSYCLARIFPHVLPNGVRVYLPPSRKAGCPTLGPRQAPTN